MSRPRRPAPPPELPKRRRGTPAFAGAHDPAAILPVLRKQGKELRARLADTPEESARHASLLRKIEENEEAIRRARSSS